MIDSRLIQLALKIAKTGYPNRTFFLAAVGIRKDGRLVYARNRTTKVPDIHGHAEARLIRKLGKNPQLVLVVRYSKLHGGFCMAKPCKSCEKLLKKTNVRKILFSTETEITTLQ